MCLQILISKLIRIVQTKIDQSFLIKSSVILVLNLGNKEQLYFSLKLCNYCLYWSKDSLVFFYEENKNLK